MKKFRVMLALAMVLTMLLSATACNASGSWVSRVDKLCDQEEDITYYRFRREALEDLVDEIEDEADDLEGDILRAYFVQDEDFVLIPNYTRYEVEYEAEGSYCCVLEFEKAADAKMVAEYFDDEGEFWYMSEPEIMLDIKKVERKGNAVILGDKNMVKMLVD